MLGCRFVLSAAVALSIGTISAMAQTLTLQEYLDAVEASHPAIRSAQFAPDLAEAEITNALGGFDPALSAEYSYKDKSGTDKLNFFDGSLELPLDMIFGPKLSASYRRGIGSFVDPENATNIAGEASLDVSLPIFQGIFTDKRRNALRKALVKPEIARAQFVSERNFLLLRAGVVYWDWTEAENALDVADTVYQLALKRYNQVVSRVKAGQEAAIDSVEIAQEVQRRLGQRYAVQLKAEQARTKLAGMLWTSNVMTQIQESPEPLPETPSSAITIEEATNTALTSRPEVSRMAGLQKLARLDSSLASEYLRPFVELKAGVSSLDVNSVSTLDYRLGFRVEQPLLFRSASATMQNASIGVQRVDLSQQIILRKIQVDAQNAVIAVNRAADRLSVATTEVQLAGQMVEAEQRKLENGASSLLQINLRERFLAQALLRLVKAKADWARAALNLQWAMGTI